MKIFFIILVFIRRIVYFFFYNIDIYVLKRKSLITIFCYHSIENNNWKFTVRPDEFIKQINFLNASGYDFITLSDLKNYLDNKKNITKPSILITFDDGYKGLIEIAGFLKSKKIYPSLFVLSNRKNPNRAELGTNQMLLTKKDLLLLANRYKWGIGSHTSTHSNLTKLSARQLQAEITESREILSNEIKSEIWSFAYPRGKYNVNAIDLVKRSNYKIALTMNDGMISKNSDPLLLPRVGVDASHSFNEFKMLFSPSVIWFRSLLKILHINFVI